MGKTGPKAEGKVSIKWSGDFAYAIGLITSDGCLSPSGRHIIFVSKDEEQLQNFTNALNIEVNTTFSYPRANKIRRIQFGDVLFYRFLLSIGLMPNKSKVLGAIAIPEDIFFDFLRGVFDGDGSIHSYMDKRWRSSYMFYTIFSSASPDFILWLQETIEYHLHIKGHVTSAKGKSTLQLKYAKKESLLLLKKMYSNKNGICLMRKRLKIMKILRIVGESL